MLIPSIDITNGNAVQLEEGKVLKINAGDPFLIADNFSIAGEIAVIDIDAAKSEGSNQTLIIELVKKYNCRVGGGIRDEVIAKKYLNAGAKKIIIGTKATPEFLKNLPKSKLIVALDCYNQEVVVEGWKKNTRENIFDKIAELKDYVSEFLVTFVELEGKEQGTNLELAKEIINAAKPTIVTIAGGITTENEIKLLDQLGADSQVGMAIYSGKLDFATAMLAPILNEHNDKLIPTIVSNQRGLTLGLAWSNLESLQEAIKTKSGVYHSRKRGLWRKGESSSNTQELININFDCDRDVVLFTVKQAGEGFCHNKTDSCFGNFTGLERLIQTISERKENSTENSFTSKLLSNPNFLNEKILEEAQEVTTANTKEDMIWEISDLLYFTMTKMIGNNIDFSEIERELDRRSQ